MTVLLKRAEVLSIIIAYPVKNQLAVLHICSLIGKDVINLVSTYALEIYTTSSLGSGLTWQCKLFQWSTPWDVCNISIY